MAGRAPWLVLIAACPVDWLALAAGVDDVICSWLRMLKLALVVCACACVCKRLCVCVHLSCDDVMIAKLQNLGICLYTCCVQLFRTFAVHMCICTLTGIKQESIVPFVGHRYSCVRIR
jgi:hypothetical protein